LDDRGYENLLASRVALQRFLRWSQEQAAVAGLTTAQHQLLLVRRIHPDPPSPTIGELASYLLIRHHSAVQLADRVEALGLVRRHRDDDGRRLVRLQLTPAGARRRAALGAAHLEELRRLASLATAAAAGLDAAAGAEPHCTRLDPSASEGARSRPTGSTGWARLPPAGHPWRAPGDRPPRTRRPWR
jgi:DNA-binding MarR family transcriptional regulator